MRHIGGIVLSNALGFVPVPPRDLAIPMRGNPLAPRAVGARELTVHRKLLRAGRWQPYGRGHSPCLGATQLHRLHAMRNILAALPLIVSFAATAQALPAGLAPVAAAVDIADQAARLRGNKVQMAVLGTTHLREAPEALAQQAMFDPLIDRLAAFKPDLVAVESIAGAQCDYLRAYEFAYEDTAKTYCTDPTPARALLKLDGVAAEREIERALSAGHAFTPAQRRRLIALFLAAGEPASACVQWLRLAPAERLPDANLNAELIAQVEKRLLRRSEDTFIAIPLALKLGLERIYPVDDHTGDRATGPIDEAAWGANMKRIWGNPHAETRRLLDKQALDRAVTSGDVLAWYGWSNSVQAAQLTVAGDFGAAAGDPSKQRTGRAYLAYWETRNLRMVANLREVVGRTQANRALTIVGASHKPYYERYLGMTSDIDLVAIDTLLKR